MISSSRLLGSFLRLIAVYSLFKLSPYTFQLPTAFATPVSSTNRLEILAECSPSRARESRTMGMIMKTAITFYT